MIIIGITGGIASGKSLVSLILKSMGYQVFNTDEEAKKIMEHDNSVKENIISIFGEESYKKNKLNSSFIRKIVFDNIDLRNKLNNIVHPLTSISFQKWVEKYNKNKFLFVESAILLQVKLLFKIDIIIGVFSDMEIRKERILKRGLKIDEFKKINKTQIDDKNLIMSSNYIIYNNESVSVIKQIMDFQKKYNFFEVCM